MSVTATQRASLLQRWWRGLTTCLTFLVAPLGRLLGGRWIRRVEPERLEHGLLLVLPGIESQSFLNISIFNGLLDSGIPHAIEIFDWTTGWNPLFLYHLRGWRRNRRMVERLARRIQDYQRDYPGRPVWLIGHSGGGAISVLAAESLPEIAAISGLILLGPALSPSYPLNLALQRTQHGIWNFYSRGDWLFLGLGTLVCGTLDGRHTPAAGFVGFQSPPETPADHPSLVQIPYDLRMLLAFNAGGHFGCANRVFVAEHVAPILRRSHGVEKLFEGP
ncbi:MAG TPA: alpha/beta hydrolase [Planctomycetaceae bacterium]|nr:alpha/beta hydrolase [Planctomycetaceae bacterium]